MRFYTFKFPITKYNLNRTFLYLYLSFTFHRVSLLKARAPFTNNRPRDKHTLSHRTHTSLWELWCDVCIFVLNFRRSSSAGARPWRRPFSPWQQRRRQGPRGPKPTACPLPPPPPPLPSLSPALPRKTRRRSSAALPRRSETEIGRERGEGGREGGGVGCRGNLERESSIRVQSVSDKLFVTRFF